MELCKKKLKKHKETCKIKGIKPEKTLIYILKEKAPQDNAHDAFQCHIVI